MPSKNTKLSIVIPVYNEVSTVEEVLRRISKLKLARVTKEIIVVDDGSSDGTTKLLKFLQKKMNFSLKIHKINTGKGAAVRTGLKFVTGEIILIQDADLEYNIDEYPELVQPIIQGKTKFVMGSRHLNTRGWKTREFLDSKVYARILNTGGVLYNILVNTVYNVKLTDPGTMYKVFHRDCLDGITLKSNHFDIDWEIVGKFLRKGYKPLEIPVSYKSRSPKEGKKIKFVRDGCLIFIAIIKYRFFD